MAFLDELRGARASDVAWVRALDGALSSNVQRFEPDFAHIAFDRGADPEWVVYADETPPLGLHGVGLLRTEGNQWVPAMLLTNDVAVEATLQRPLPAAAFPGLVELVARIGLEVPPALAVIGIEPPDHGAAAVHGDMYGTLGAIARNSDGGVVALTAGHVARAVDTSVVIDGSISARVAYSNHRYRHAYPETCADVAVLELDQDLVASLNIPHYSRVGRYQELGSLVPYNRSGIGVPAGGLARFAGDRFPVNSTEGCWGDFIMADAISAEGDSGAIVVNSADEVVGQVVGGLTGGFSIVQNISYILSDASVALAFP